MSAKEGERKRPQILNSSQPSVEDSIPHYPLTWGAPAPHSCFARSALGVCLHGGALAVCARSCHLVQVLARHRVIQLISSERLVQGLFDTATGTRKMMAKLKAITGTLSQGLSRRCQIFSFWRHHHVGQAVREAMGGA